MKITEPIGPIQSARVVSYPPQSRVAGPKPQHAAGGSDPVTLSDAAVSVAQAAEKIKQMPTVDMEKVNRIKTMLRDGTYTVDADKAASCLLTEALLEDQ